MDNFFEKTQKLSNGHLLELAGFCAGTALLLFAAVFVSGGFGEQSGLLSSVVSPASQTASIFPCSWFGDCPSGLIYRQAFDSGYPTTIAAGQSALLSWNIYGEKHALFCINGSSPCSITPDAPRSPDCVYSFRGRSIVYVSGYCTGNISGTDGFYTVAPTRTTTYYLCSDYLNKQGVGCTPYTITVPVAVPTTLTSLTASPSSVNGTRATTLTWSGTKGTNFSACELTGGQWGSGAWFSALPGTVTTNTLTTTTTYNMDCFDTTGASTGWHSATVTVVAPLGPCNDIPAQTTVPNGCVTPVPAPGTCTPTGGSYSASSNSCSCPASKHLAGSSCVNNPLCGNGLADSYAPSCTCPSGQYQPLGGSSCAVLPICANGLNSSYSPSCTCPSGQEPNGATCVLQGVINTLTANPSRVLKGNKTTVTWTTSNMAGCTLSALDANGTTNLVNGLSSSLNPVIAQKTIYTLGCTDKAGKTYSSSVTVNLIPQTIEQ